MQIKTNSWHYKLNKFVSGGATYDIPTSLCPYFWRTVWFMFIISGVSALVLFGAYLVGLTPLTMILSTLGLAISGTMAIVPSIIVGAILFCVTFGTAFGIFVLGAYSVEKVQEYNENRPAKEPGLVASFVKAKKSKYCPKIEFIHNED